MPCVGFESLSLRAEISRRQRWSNDGRVGAAASGKPTAKGGDCGGRQGGLSVTSAQLPLHAIRARLDAYANQEHTGLLTRLSLRVCRSVADGVRHTHVTLLKV